GNRMIDLVGKTSIPQFMAVIERAAVVLANDSAALHVAVGFDRPLVGLLGATRPDLVGPYQREKDVICSSEIPSENRHKDQAFGQKQMSDIPIETVYSAMLDRLADVSKQS
ncbi:MAG: glycosyltransferase family 9 protein, partial [Planctomycetota bacterium]